MQRLWIPTGKPVMPSTIPVGQNPEREPPAEAELESKGREWFSLLSAENNYRISGYYDFVSQDRLTRSFKGSA